MAQTWKEQLKDALIKQVGKQKGEALFDKYQAGITHSYSDDYDVNVAVSDIDVIEMLSAENPLITKLYYSEGEDIPLHLRLFQWRKAIALSDILPMLENLNLRTENENPHKITVSNENVWISDFAVEHKLAPFDINAVKDLFQDALAHVYLGLAEDDGFNKLVLGAALSWREIMILRAYAKYLRQVEFRFSQSYIEKALINHTDIAKNLVKLFLTLHDPLHHKNAKADADAIDQEILKAFDLVTSLDEDKILRRISELIHATLRTNYFQLNADKKHKEYVSFKLNSRLIPELPLPVPLYEIFIYSPRFEAIHLRYEKVARGGLRWSDRLEDFRTEVLGLMKAQVVKNAVIVPSGAKGGFVLKKLPASCTREDIQTEVIYCYKEFIRGLLDITDNIVNGKNVRPKQVVCYDEFDSYLVVAADKGTSTFSDIANGISKEYHFWLGDAFASGGSAGYDHKKMGITARGAWESIKRHFREFNIDVLNTDITVVGIGDMSGDVFGNGMMYTKHIKLIAAFDHRHIFIDPTPDPKTSYAERVRLFNLPTSSWENYDANLISKGGGVFKRSLKSITITPEMQRALGIESNSLAPNELIRAILIAPVDLLFNGGIGTYVKSSTQSNAEVGDRTNDYCRVNGNELRCRVVGEGGNLGFTQEGRIEYAQHEGLIFTDFIDNSAGVDCSDHEVNLKILLDPEVNKDNITLAQRDTLLASLTDEVAKLVLIDNYDQALVLSYSAYRATKNIGLHTTYIKELEGLGALDRQVEFLPDDKTLIERKAANQGLTRPELAVLLAYTKIFIKNELLKSKLPDDPYLSKVLVNAFPESIRKKYTKDMMHHKLHKEIIVTQLSNQIVNEMGITFVYRVQMETGSTVEDIVRAYAVASNIFGTPELESLIASLDFKIPMDEQYEMFYHIRNLISLATRWFLRNNRLHQDLEDLIDHYAVRVKTLEALTPELMSGFTKNYLNTLTQQFLKAGIESNIAKHIATYRAIYTSLNIIEVASKNKFDLEKTARVYFSAGERVNLLWFRDQLLHDTREGHWNTLARLTLRDELDIAQRMLTIAIINHDKNEKDPEKLIDAWMCNNHHALDRWDKILSLIHSSNTVDYTMFFIALRELLSLVTR